MFRSLVFVALLFAFESNAHLSSPICRDVQIPLSISAPRFQLNATIEDNWSAVSLSFNLTRRDSGQPADPLPISGTIAAPVLSNFTIGATLCGTGKTVLVLTHGIIESKLYWRPNFKDAEKYSFVDAALAAGYSVLSYDRIGVGTSSNVNSLTDAQYQVEVAVLEALITYAKAATSASKVALIGHSYGAYLSAGAANRTAVDAVVLTGFSGSFDYFAPFVAGAGLRVARTQNSKRWGHLDSGFLTTSDLYATTYVYYREPYFEHRIAEWSHNIADEPFAMGELPSLLASYDNFNAVRAPVFVLQGQFDVSACGGNCVGVVNESTLRGKLFRNAKAIQWIDDLPAGHNLNLHKVAPQAFHMIFTFLRSQGV